MATLSNSTYTIQDAVRYARSFAELVPVLGASGFSQEPAVSIANDVLQLFLAESLAWKFNRAYIRPFTTVPFQQDYIGVSPLSGPPNTPVLDLGWLEKGTRIDINNTAIPKPEFPLEAVRELDPTFIQATPFQLSWIPIPLARYGTWLPNQVYMSGVGPTGAQQQFPSNSPIQQIIDPHGNYLYVSGYGTSASTGSGPDAGPNATPGTTVTDGTVTWTVADPRGIAIRLYPMPPLSGITWQICPVYQMKPPVITSLQSTIAPIPDSYAYLFRQGFLALCKDHNAPGSRESMTAIQMWQAALQTAVRSGDREREDYGFYPSNPVVGTGVGTVLPLGPSNPYNYGYPW